MLIKNGNSGKSLEDKQRPDCLCPNEELCWVMPEEERETWKSSCDEASGIAVRPPQLVEAAPSVLQPPASLPWSLRDDCNQEHQNTASAAA